MHGTPPAAIDSEVSVRTEPYRLFFPLAALLGIAGVAHWLLFSLGAIGRYLGRFHAVTQTQSFLLAFAVGFLLTAIPKRTRSAPASRVEIGALAVLVPLVSVATLHGSDLLGQAAYGAALVVLAQFAIRRFVGRASGRRPPASFALVPVALAAGLGGAALTAAGLVGLVPAWALGLGRRFVFEGVFSCLALGIGPFFLPLALRGEAAPDAGPSARRPLVAYALTGLVLVGSLALDESGSTRLGPLARGLVAVAVLGLSGAWRLPTRPGLNRRLLWAAAWMIPLGLLLAAAFPDRRVEALHVAFIGGFGVLAFAVAAHVTFGHTGRAAEQDGRPFLLVAFAALVLSAMLLRALATSVPERYFEVLGAAAVLWVAAVLSWAVLLVPKLWRAAPAGAAAPHTAP